MKINITTHNYRLTDQDEAALEHLERKLGHYLRHVDPDLASITLDLERHSRREEFLGSGRLVIFNRALPAKRNSAPTLGVLIKRIGQDLEDQVRRFRARLGREFVYGRKRGALTSAEQELAERQMGADRDLYERALQGEEAAWQELVELERPRLGGVIAAELGETGGGPGGEGTDELLDRVLERGFRDLARKPARWSIFGWLTWLARREARGEAHSRRPSGGRATVAEAS
jgi:hypothetical protein